MQLSRPLRVAVGTVVASLAALFVGRLFQRRRRRRFATELRHTATTDRDEVFTMDDLEGLPEPVRDYLANVLEEGQRYVRTVRLEEEGTLRAGGADSAWKPFTATQYVTTDPPGFFWDASVRLWPPVALRVGDRYCGGRGSASVTLLGALPLGGDEASATLNEGELLRYLAEAVWYPTALLPSEGVEWEAVDDDAAVATLEYGGATAALEFRFTDDDEVSSVHAERRPRRVGDGYEPTPWTGRWHDYETRDGMCVPTAGEVVWHLPEGEMEAWRGRLTDVEYDAW